MFKDLLLNNRTAEALKLFAAKPSHAVLITGETGSGKLTVARHLAAVLLGTKETKLNNSAYFLHIKKLEDKKDISIEQIRSVIHELGLKVPGKKEVKRVILIENAQQMSLPAQNALLKSLEEPSDYSIFILTAPSASSLLPTIASRATKVAIHPVDLADAKKFYQAESSEIEAAWNLSRGSVGLMTKLLASEPSDLAASVETAKKFLAMTAYERTIEIDKIAKEKEEFEALLDALARIVQALYNSAAAKNEAVKLRNLTKAMSLILSAQSALAANAAPRLVALQISTNLPI